LREISNPFCLFSLIVKGEQEERFIVSPLFQLREVSLDTKAMDFAP